MKILLKHSYFLLLLIFQNFYGQIDTQKENFKKFTNIKEALLNPENVIYLDLSNQTEGLSNIDFSRFKNLQYLNLKKSSNKNSRRDLFNKNIENIRFKWK